MFFVQITTTQIEIGCGRAGDHDGTGTGEAAEQQRGQAQHCDEGEPLNYRHSTIVRSRAAEPQGTAQPMKRKRRGSAECGGAAGAPRGPRPWSSLSSPSRGLHQGVAASFFTHWQWRLWLQPTAHSDLETGVRSLVTVPLAALGTVTVAQPRLRVLLSPEATTVARLRGSSSRSCSKSCSARSQPEAEG